MMTMISLMITTVSNCTMNLNAAVITGVKKVAFKEAKSEHFWL